VFGDPVDREPEVTTRLEEASVSRHAPVTFLTSSKNCFLLSVLMAQFTGGLWNPSW
jgi:hypothetical protein